MCVCYRLWGFRLVCAVLGFVVLKQYFWVEGHYFYPQRSIGGFCVPHVSSGIMFITVLCTHSIWRQSSFSKKNGGNLSCLYIMWHRFMRVQCVIQNFKPEQTCQFHIENWVDISTCGFSAFSYVKYLQQKQFTHVLFCVVGLLKWIPLFPIKHLKIRA